MKNPVRSLKIKVIGHWLGRVLSLRYPAAYPPDPYSGYHRSPDAPAPEARLECSRNYEHRLLSTLR